MARLEPADLVARLSPEVVGGSDKRWTFLTKHATILLYITARPDAKIRDIGNAVGLTERTTAAVIADLRAEGYIEVGKAGRRNRYEVNFAKPLRRPFHAAWTVADLVSALRMAGVEPSSGVDKGAG